MKWLAMLFLLLIPGLAQAADTTYVEVGQANAGHVIYFGNDLNANSFAIDIGFSVEGSDTTWSKWVRLIGNPSLNQGLTRLPFNPPPPAAPPATSLQEARQAVLEQATLAPRSVHFRTSTERMQATVTTLTNSELIDSVRVESEFVYWYKWHGENNWWRNSVAAPRTPVNRELMFRTDAEEILAALQANQLVIIDKGFVRCTATEAQRKALEEDLTAIRAGGQLVAHEFIPSRVLANIQRPNDLRTVVQGGGQR